MSCGRASVRRPRRWSRTRSPAASTSCSPRSAVWAGPRTWFGVRCKRAARPRCATSPRPRRGFGEIWARRGARWPRSRPSSRAGADRSIRRPTACAGSKPWWPGRRAAARAARACWLGRLASFLPTCWRSTSPSRARSSSSRSGCPTDASCPSTASGRASRPSSGSLMRTSPPNAAASRSRWRARSGRVCASSRSTSIRSAPSPSPCSRCPTRPMPSHPR